MPKTSPLTPRFLAISASSLLLATAAHDPVEARDFWLKRLNGGQPGFNGEEPMVVLAAMRARISCAWEPRKAGPRGFIGNSPSIPKDGRVDGPQNVGLPSSCHLTGRPGLAWINEQARCQS